MVGRNSAHRGGGHTSERDGEPLGLPPVVPGCGLVVFRWFGENPPPTLGLAEQIAAAIGDRIATSIIAPGARIVEQGIAGEFETSRGPVREALRILEREKLVRIHPRRGARATQLSRQDVFELFETRALLYQAVGRSLAEARPPAAIRMLEEGVRELRNLAEHPDEGQGYAHIVFRLSLGCARASGNRLLGELLTSLALQTHRYSRLGLASRARRRTSVAMWLRYLEAIRRGDGASAAELAARLVLAGRDEVLRLLTSEPAPKPASKSDQAPFRAAELPALVGFK